MPEDFFWGGVGNTTKLEDLFGGGGEVCEMCEEDGGRKCQ